MHVLVGVSLSLLLSAGNNYDGPNGFDPTSMVVFMDGGKIKADLAEGKFKKWLDGDGSLADQKRRIIAVGYFVACAFDQGTVIRVGQHSWPGALGLAPTLQHALKQLEDGNKRISLVPDPEDGKWVSACLLAFANMSGSHEYVWLRGNPPGWRSPAPRPTPLPGSLRWTMGYPEGAFFADLISFTATSGPGPKSSEGTSRSPTRAELEKGFTLSLNLPKGYSGLAAEQWAPPNASNGRTLDYDHVTSADVSSVGHYHIAENLGAYLDSRHHFLEEATHSDPNYPHDTVCVGSERSVVACPTEGAARLRPLFAHAPRVVSLASATRRSRPATPIQAMDVGESPLTPSQGAICTAGVDCTGPFKLTAVGESPAAPNDRVARLLTGLTKGQKVEVVLRFDAAMEGYQLDADDLKNPYTAIIRFKSRVALKGIVEASTKAGGWKTFEASWAATSGDWEWLQVYPVHVDPSLQTGKQPVLRVRISGVASGKDAPALDLAGFVSGPPWCHPDPENENAEKEFAAVCRGVHEDSQGLKRLPLVRLPISYRGSLKADPAPTKAK